MPIFDPYFATRRRLKFGLTIAGIVAGVAFGIMLTGLGKLVTGAPPAAAANYWWNATIFGILAGVVSPLVTWSVLRRAPLWRTIFEPLALAVAGGTTALLVGVPVLLLVLPPAGLALGFAHLHRRYPEPQRQIATRPANER